jgi:hypothetical protein
VDAAATTTTTTADAANTTRREGVAFRDVERQPISPSIEGAASKRRAVPLGIARETGGQRMHRAGVVMMMIHRSMRRGGGKF